MIVVDVLNTLFWFCGAVAFAGELTAHSCSNQHFLDTNKVTNGTSPGNREKRCREGQASTAFLWFGFASFAVSSVMSGLQGKSSGMNMRGGAGGVRRTGV